LVLELDRNRNQVLELELDQNLEPDRNQVLELELDRNQVLELVSVLKQDK
jgi:hypothetical protein